MTTLQTPHKQLGLFDAEEYKASLPKRKSGRKGVIWTAENFGVYANLLYPHITFAPDQTWVTVLTKYKFICNIHGEYEAAPNHFMKANQGCLCKGCHSDKAKARAGVVRATRGTAEEKELAAKLKSQGLPYSAIALQVGKTPGTICRWLNPESAKKSIEYAARYFAANRDKHNANVRRWSKHKHARAIKRAAVAHRRLLETNAPEFVFFDNQWHEVDRRKSYKIFGEVLLPASERKAIQELYLEAQYLTETTGIEHHVDHIQPLSKGGEHCVLNLQILPATENLSKQGTFRQQDAELLCSRLFA